MEEARGFAGRRPLVAAYDPDRLLGCRRLQHAERAFHVVRDVVRPSSRASALEPRGPRRILLYGGSSAEMATVVALAARHARRQLLRVACLGAIPTTDGGSQPMIAAALNAVRVPHACLIWLDGLESLAVADHRAQRAFHDLLYESVRPSFAPATAVVGTFRTGRLRPVPPPLMRRRFGRCAVVDLPHLGEVLGA